MKRIFRELYKRAANVREEMEMKLREFMAIIVRLLNCLIVELFYCDQSETFTSSESFTQNQLSKGSNIALLPNNSTNHPPTFFNDSILLT